MKTPTVLVILDGLGIGSEFGGNAILAADTPNLDRLMQNCPSTILSASGADVGLLPGQPGSSVAGLTNLGAGSIMLQDDTILSIAVEDGSFFENEKLARTLEECARSDAGVHLLALLSPDLERISGLSLWPFLRLAKSRGIKKAWLHCVIDGMDSVAGKNLVSQCVKICGELGIGTLATIMGSSYILDRECDKKGLNQAYNALVSGAGVLCDNLDAVMNRAYGEGITDGFLPPVICDKSGVINPGDTLIFTNFGPIGVRKIAGFLTDPELAADCERVAFPVHCIFPTRYDYGMPGVYSIFRQSLPAYGLGEYFSGLNMSQLRIATGERFGHLCYFFNGGARVLAYEGERRIEIESKPGISYELSPDLGAEELTRRLLEEICSGEYDFIAAQYANCDLAGHSGSFAAACKGLEAVDEAVGVITDAVSQMGGICLITATHGNAEQMLCADGVTPFSGHTANPVPLIISGAQVPLEKGRLCDVAPTILDLLGLKQPVEMTGKSLIKKV